MKSDLTESFKKEFRGVKGELTEGSTTDSEKVVYGGYLPPRELRIETVYISQLTIIRNELSFQILKIFLIIFQRF